MTHSMLTWFEAQLNEAQQIAEGGYYDSWHTKECGNDQNSAFFGDCTCDVKDQVLSDIASKRAILAIHSLELAYTHDDVTSGSGPSRAICGMCEDGRQSALDWPCDTVRALGSAFATREGYLSEWGPT